MQRVQNLSMWTSYSAKRHSVLMREAQGASTAAAEARMERVWLFHGTNEDMVPKITQQGFNRIFTGVNSGRAYYGKGVYFARDASYSSDPQYSKRNAQGIQHMFLVRVVVGEYCVGVMNQPVPDVRHGTVLYDSTVDDLRDPSVFVTYHDAQVYPEYLVKFSQ